MRTDDRGSAAVEFALVLPLLLLLTLALVQVGLLARDQLLLTQAARAAAREAAVSPDPEAAREAALAAAPGLDATLLDLVVTRLGGRGDPVEVALRYPAPVSVPLVGAVLPEVVVLDASAAARQEFAQ